MKRFITILGIIAVCASFAFAEDVVTEKPAKKDKAPATLFGSKDMTFSGYGAPTVRFGNAAGKWAVYHGMRGGLIINDSFVIGAGGMCLAYPYDREELTGRVYTGTEDRTAFGYGGMLFEYHFFPKDLINFSVGTLIGGGSAGFHGGDMDRGSGMGWRGGNIFFVTEPEVMAYVNVTRFFRIGAGVTYRFVNGIDISGLKDSDFRGLNGSLLLAFGWF